MKRFERFFAVLLVGGLVAGCADPGPRNGRIVKGGQGVAETAEQQVEQLNDRARRMPKLTAQAPLGGVTVRYPDKDGKPQKDNVDGRLWILQHFEAAPPTADVVFYGRVSGQEILQAGKNDKDWWCILHPNGNHAWTGDVRTPAGEGQEAILRADRVLDVLAITLIEPAGGLKMTMNRSADGKANVLRFARAAGGQEAAEREISIDRKSGLPTDVTLFDAEGQPLVHARLDTYRPVDYASPDDAPKDGRIPLMPHHIILEYPAAKSSIEMNFNDVSVPRRINPAVFKTPDWEDLDIKPEVVQ